MYDGSSLRISAKNSRTFNLPIGIDIEEETRDNISEAIQAAFQTPQVIFISNKDLYSSD